MNSYMPWDDANLTLCDSRKNMPKNADNYKRKILVSKRKHSDSNCNKKREQTSMDMTPLALLYDSRSEPSGSLNWSSFRDKQQLMKSP